MAVTNLPRPRSLFGRIASLLINPNFFHADRKNTPDNTLDETIELKNQYFTLLKKGGFWLS